MFKLRIRFIHPFSLFLFIVSFKYKIQYISTSSMKSISRRREYICEYLLRTVLRSLSNVTLLTVWFVKMLRQIRVVLFLFRISPSYSINEKFSETHTELPYQKIHLKNHSPAIVFIGPIDLFETYRLSRIQLVARHGLIW